MATDIARLHAVFDLAMRIGEGMLSYGAAASDVTATVLRITSSSGLRNVVAEATFSEVSISYLADDTATPFTRIRSAGNRSQDFARLDALEKVTLAYIEGKATLEEARRRVDQIAAEKPQYSMRTLSAGNALLGAGSALSFGAGPLVMVAAAITSVVLLLVSTVLGRRHVPDFYTQLAAGFIGVVSAMIVNAIDPAVNSSIVVVTSIIVMLAGLTSIGAMQDAITGWYLTASARILETLMLTIGLVVGVRVGIVMSHLLGLDVSISAALPLTLISAVWLAVAGFAIGVGYAVSAHTPPTAVLWVAVAALVSALVNHTLNGVFDDRAMSVGVAATVVGVLSIVFSARLRMPALMFVMGGVIPLVPGSRIYRGLLALQDDVVRGGFELFSAAEIAIAIAAGAVFGQLIATRVFARSRRTRIWFAPVISAPFSTSRRRLSSMSRRRLFRRSSKAVYEEPSTMTTEMVALTPEMFEDDPGEITGITPPRP